MIYAPFVFRIGQLWIQVHPPNPTTKLRMISVGDANHVWALDTSDRLYMRQETSSPAFPEVIEFFLVIEKLSYRKYLNVLRNLDSSIFAFANYRAQAG